MRNIYLITLFSLTFSFTQAQYWPCDNWVSTSVALLPNDTDDYVISYNDISYECPGEIRVGFWWKTTNALIDVKWDDIDYFRLSMQPTYSFNGVNIDIQKSEMKYTNNMYVGGIRNSGYIYSNIFPTSIVTNVENDSNLNQLLTVTFKVFIKADRKYKYQSNAQTIPYFEPSYPDNSIYLDLCEKLIDSDEDGKFDNEDNCSSISNPDQLDNDNDGIGNACDNCVNYANSNQKDTDNDGIGDSCDDDDDNDEIEDYQDNCQFTPNTNQDDSDGDGIGDVCDSIDGNSLPNLTLSSFTVKVGSTTYDAYSDSENVPEFKYGEVHTFNITIKNDGNVNALSSNYKLLVSEANVYPRIGTKPVFEYRNENAGSIDGNSEKTSTFEDYFNDYISSLNLEDGEEYYMFIDIDPENDVDESDETDDDNLESIKFKYKKSSTTGKMSLKVNNSINVEVEYYYSSPINNIKIYNLFGNSIVYDSNVFGQTSIVNVQSPLTAGLYSIYVNNIFIKKIKIFNSGFLTPVHF